MSPKRLKNIFDKSYYRRYQSEIFLFALFSNTKFYYYRASAVKCFHTKKSKSCVPFINDYIRASVNTALKIPGNLLENSILERPHNVELKHQTP